MTAKLLSLVLHFSTRPDNPTELARRFIAAMPTFRGARPIPRTALDERLLAEPRAPDFEAGLEGIGIQDGTGPSGWSGGLDYLGHPRAGTLGLGCGFHPSVATLWPYLREVAEATTRELCPAAATLGGLSFTANPAATLAEVPVPRVFAPWTYISLAGLPASLADGLRALPAADVRDHADGLVIEAVRDPHEQPDPAFVRALEALPLTPRASYRHLRFPAPGNPV